MAMSKFNYMSQLVLKETAFDWHLDWKTEAFFVGKFEFGYRKESILKEYKDFAGFSKFRCKESYPSFLKIKVVQSYETFQADVDGRNDASSCRGE